MITTTHSATRRRVTVAALAALSLLVLPSVALAEAGPRRGAGDPGRRRSARARRRSRQACREMKLLKTTPDIALAGAAVTISGERPARRTRTSR